jgi:hypothetical protein
MTQGPKSNRGEDPLMLSHEQNEIVELVKVLEPDQVQRVLDFTRKVKAEPAIDYSDEWSEEDLREFSNDCLRRIDEIDPYDWPESEKTSQKEGDK